jgi:dolichol-phosphate mannosyltransferase
MSTIDISIIIPVYFNEGSIKLTYRILKEEILVKFPELQFEIIFIDDGSRDNSFNEMSEIKKTDNDVKLIQFTRNFGQVSAFYAGYEFSSGKGILNLAADLQEPPELIISIIDSFIKKEAMIIAGKRIERDESFYRTKTSHFFYYIMKRLSFSNMPNGGFDIVIIDQKVKDFILDSKESNPFWQGQILWSGYSIKFIPYTRQKRLIGKSKWTFAKKMKYLLDGILNYSYTPLRFFSIVGMISFLLGIIYSIVIVISFLNGNSPFKGWAPIMIVILLFSGLQLMMTGIIGEYLWRAFEQTKNRPKYVINRKE